LGGFTSVTASASLITLTASSTPDYVVTGSGGQTIKLPDATTLPNGYVFTFDNNQSSGSITVNNNSNTLIVSVPSGGFVYLRLLSNVIAAGSWDRHDLAPSNVSWSTNTFDYPGSITSATWNGSTVAVNRGGTGLSSTPANGQIDIGNGTGFTRATLTAGSNISITNASGAITITGTGAGAAVDQTDIGTRANQIPLNQYLGTMAWQDAKAVRLGGDAVINTLTVGLGSGSVATNTATGYQALNANTTGANNTAYGYQALKLNTIGASNVAVGYQAGYSNTTDQSVFVGSQAGYSASTGIKTAIGFQAMYNATTSATSTAIGYRALYNLTTNGGDDAVAVGYQAGYSNTTGGANTAIGVNSLYANITGNYNTAVGRSALTSNTASNNTAVGYQAGSTITTGSNNILIGFQSAPSAITVSNEITIGNSSNTVIRYPHSYGTVASLPSASTVGRGSRTFVTDALTPTFQATVTGGGAVFTPVYSDGTNWKVG
jgi:hypothetical protein